MAKQMFLTIIFSLCCRHMIQILKRSVMQVTGRRWVPRQAVCDFELALHQALEAEFPGIAIAGCYFHFTKALFKNILVGNIYQYIVMDIYRLISVIL